MRGAKPKPTALKVLAGNPGRRPLNDLEPQPTVGSMDPPPGLSEEAARHWGIVSHHLHECGLLTEIDKPAFRLYCEAFARWHDANEQISIYGPVVKSPKGFVVQSPYLGIANRAHDQMVKLLVEFGMTPSSRSRVAVEQKAKPSNVYDNLDS